MMTFLGIEGNRDCYSPDQRESCTVGQLINWLSDYDADLPVYLVNDNGYTFGSLGPDDIGERTVTDDGDLVSEDMDDMYESLKSTLNTRRYKRTRMTESKKKYTGQTWSEFIDDIEDNSDFVVDAAYKRYPDEWIVLYNKYTNDAVDAEVTKYSDGTYELMDYNIYKNYKTESKGSKCSRRKKRIKESASSFKIDFVSQEAAKVRTWDDLDAVLSSLLSIDKDLYRKYSEMYRLQKYSPSYIGGEISDELYYMTHPQSNTSESVKEWVEDEHTLEFEGHLFDPYSEWYTIYDDVIVPITNEYMSKGMEDEIPNIIEEFEVQFGEYTSVDKACERFFDKY